ncbi:MAG TPA: class I SAM-dependent methyltransferase [Anaerolineales bacterium]|nr:class I SAM-dependent methyltransferase [Anaerolineales bacterium]
MTTSRSFDRAASYYDQTRPLPEPAATKGIESILEIIGAEARVLEVGAGTGRISIPLLQRGMDLIGCDLSSSMLGRLQNKFSSARLTRADASRLPFPAASFDIVMTVHVLHLVPAWREALREFKRLLKPGGAYLNVKTWTSAGVSIREQMRLHWQGWLAARGVDARHPGVQNQTELQQELQSLAKDVKEIEVLRYPLVFTLREELERLASRIYSDTWDVPDDLFNTSQNELRDWVKQGYVDLDQPRQDEIRFAIDVIRF